MNWRASTIGVLVGSVFTACAFLAWGFGQALDAGVTITHQSREVETLRHESDVLKKMAEVHWIGLDGDTAREALEALGVFDFAKGESGFAAGPVFLVVDGDHVTEIQHHCARLKSQWCEKREMN